MAASEHGKPEAQELLRKTENTLKRNDVAFAFHLVAFILYVRVWTWHTTAAAMVLPGSQGFGWFFRYLTFWSYSLQLLQLGLCLITHTSRNASHQIFVSQAADKLSCAVFGLANTVTAMFYAIESTTQGLVEGGALDRPWWLELAVHVANSAVAWIDLIIVEERSFCGRSRHLALFLALSYGFFLLLVRANYGKFPYPILNKLPFPHGYLGFFGVGVVVVIITFELGRFVKRFILPKFFSSLASMKVSKQKDKSA